MYSLQYRREFYSLRILFLCQIFRKLFLLFSGTEKHEMYAKAKKPGSYKEIPLRLILSQSQTPLIVMSAP